jgi:arabinogalactan endo-1,4-beta-galactosidase
MTVLDLAVREDEPEVKQREISRRTLLKVAGVGAGAVALASPLFSNIAGEAAATFYKGADVSWLPQMEANGYKFYNSKGVQQDVLTILKGYGINAIRLRTFVNPSNNISSGHCSQSETIAMMVRCKNAGLVVDLDFMFGDTWNSVGVQNPPAAWAKLSYSALLTAIHNYVSGFMTAMKASKVAPLWVQIGNEENSGICHPVGSFSGHPTQMTGLLNTAYTAVKAAFPSTQVVIHLAQPQKLSGAENFFDTYKKLGGKWDVTGFSSYASGGALPGIISDMATVQSRYGKPVIQVEFGGPVTKPTQTAKDLTTLIKGIKGFGGLGLFYWEPEGYWSLRKSNTAAWDATTMRPTAALGGFLND